jgi:hypothetical protein
MEAEAHKAQTTNVGARAMPNRHGASGGDCKGIRPGFRGANKPPRVSVTALSVPESLNQTTDLAHDWRNYPEPKYLARLASNNVSR